MSSSNAALRALSIVVGVLTLCAGAARAQETDLTFTQPPVVMLAIDTSGSMQWSGQRIARDDKAIPQIFCALTSEEKSREVAVKEVLTGTFEDYSIAPFTTPHISSGSFGDCSAPSAGGRGDYRATFSGQLLDGVLDTYADRLRFALATFDNTASSAENSGGGWSYPLSATSGFSYSQCGTTGRCGSCSSPTCASSGTTCVQIDAGTNGNSYSRAFCRGNLGVRSLIASPCFSDADGGSATNSGCLFSAGELGSDIKSQNDRLQSEILNLRSFGGTPIAAMLKDIRVWFDTHPDVKLDPSNPDYGFMRCRKHYVLLLTDGVPSNDCGYSNMSATRPEICSFQNIADGGANCISSSQCAANFQCKPTNFTDGGYRCVSNNFAEVAQASAQRAADLYNPADGGLSAKVYAVGFDLSAALTCNVDTDCPNSQTCSLLDTSGTVRKCTCTTNAQCLVGESCEGLGDGGLSTCRLGGAIRDIAAAGGNTTALFANDPTSLRAAINNIFAQLLPESTSRTRVTSTTAVSSLSELTTTPLQVGQPGLFLFQSAFTVLSSSSHWKGFLQRVSIGRVADDAGGVPKIGPIAQTPSNHGTVRFDDLLNKQPKPETDQGVAYDRKIYFVKGTTVLEFTKTNVSPADVGITSGTTTQQNAGRDTVVDFVRGEAGSERATNRLGAIYHASPVILEPPILDLALSSYRKFKADARIRARPPMVFVGSNLGVLHAFNVVSGKEEWAFIPPALLGTLYSQTQQFTYGIDATPVARDIQLTTKDAASDPKNLDNWRSVVVVPLGLGGTGQGKAAVFALDVTDPVYSSTNDPPFKFLWQFDQTDVDGQPGSRKLGTTFASPTVGTVFLDDSGSGYAFQERGVAIIPGGQKPSSGTSGQGEDLWVLDLETGTVMKRFPATAGSGGMSGTCAALDDFPGSFITRVFCGDASGRLMRLNLAAPLLNDWSGVPAWADLYSHGPSNYADGGAIPRLPIFTAPALANRSNGNLMVLYGNGDTSDLQNTAETRMAFVEETPVVVGGAVTGYNSTLRKLLRLSGGEKLTGSPVIYNSVAYWATFVPEISTSCSFGRTRLWGVSFDKFEGNDPETAVMAPSLDTLCGPDEVIDTGDDARGITAKCLLPNGSVSFGFDLTRVPAVSYTPSVVPGPGGPGGGATPAEATVGGGLKLVFQTGTAAINETSKLRDPELTPPGSQSIQLGSIGVPNAASLVKVISWGKVTQ